MNASRIKSCAPKARRDFIEAVTRKRQVFRWVNGKNSLYYGFKLWLVFVTTFKRSGAGDKESRG
jgi:hypothetical protein